MKTLLEEASAEIEVKKSKFISIAYPVRTLEEARDMVSFTRELHPNANHVVHAAVVGLHHQIFWRHSSRNGRLGQSLFR